jgi:hydrogenase expression/formation protein HypD
MKSIASDKQILDSLMERLRSAAKKVRSRLSFMEVCGTHTTSAFRCGLRTVLPENVRLISGPGCPVCVTSQADIDELIALASKREVVLCTYGDMLRVPGRLGSLERIRGQGGRIKVVYSSLDAVATAQREPTCEVVFAAVGFETTAPSTAVAVRRAQELKLENFTVLASHKRIIPAMRALLAGRDNFKVDGFLCPGHVSVVIGSDAYLPIVRDYSVACVIGGFEPTLLLGALACLCELAAESKTALINQYPQAVSGCGNPHAQALLTSVFEPTDARWRGMGVIPESGYALRAEFAKYDARIRFGLITPDEREPKGCLCGQVISGKVEPPECTLFGRACTPVNPIGPCMVSSEGTCAAWFKYNNRLSSRSAPPMQETVV